MKKILDEINSSQDVKKLNIPQLEVLAQEIREFLVSNVSKCGGHLSSNLGTVELTLAMHKVFDFDRDKIVWDVGHQAYTHKIVTGRCHSFDTLRQKDGLSGFPKTSESPTDAFNTGHSSTSVSAALGFAKAFELEKREGYAVAFIGDGALTGGMAYEALNHAGSGETPLIVILNDNGMSIDENVGGISNYLGGLSGNAWYINLKVSVTKALKSLPLVGELFIRIAHRSKRLVKKILLQKRLFENMGLEYLGPVDGHDFKDLIAVLEYAKSLKRPVIIHAKTQKGRGYDPSEKDPSHFHGVSVFNPDTGEMKCSSKRTFSDVFSEAIVKEAEKNNKLVAITASMTHGTGLAAFAQKFPDRFFDVGIAEQHAVTFAAGLAKAGLVPVFAVYSTFLQRGYDQLLHDVCLQNLHGIFTLDRAGATGNDGETHQGIYDLSYLSHMPNMTVMAPCCGEELSQMLDFAINKCTGPVAVRYPKDCADNGIELPKDIEMGKGVVLTKGTDALIVALGPLVKEALDAAEILRESGISVTVMNARFLKPFDEELFLELAKDCKVIVTAEDNVEFGGLYGTVCGICGKKVTKIAISDKPLAQGSIMQQRKEEGLDSVSIAEKIKEVLGDTIG